MQGRFLTGLAVCLTALPALVVAQQVPAVVQVPVAVSTVAQAPVVVPAELPSAPPVTATPATAPEITVNIGGQSAPTGGLAPLAKAEFDLPAGLIPPTTASTVTRAALLPPARPTPSAPGPSAPPAKLTPAQIAQQIAPNFNVTRDYVRLTQCYGVADFMGALTRVQASRPGASAQAVSIARSIAIIKDDMQLMVLAASTVRTEARFRRDYDAIARRGQQELATSRTPNVTMQRRLASLDACRVDIARWRGGR